MRLNKFLALATGISRRAADKLIESGQITINSQSATLGQTIAATAEITISGQRLNTSALSTTTPRITIMLNKPVGYVVSREGQGSQTIYDLLPPSYQNLKPIGRLDKNSSGLLLLTNDGNLAHNLTHPKFQKEKIYQVQLDKPLTPEDQAKIQQGIKIDNYTSRLQLSKIAHHSYQITMTMGRNRQIRRTFAALGYEVIRLHRIHFGDYNLASLPPASFKNL